MNRRLVLPLLTLAAAGTIFSVPAEAALQEIAVGNFYFEDATVGDGKVEARVGDQLRFSVLDGGPGTPHTVDVDELGIHSGTLGAGKTFTTPPIDKAGTFILYCKPHDQRGHKTTLIVSPASTSPTPVPTTPTTAPTTTTTTKATATTKPPATTTTTNASVGSAPTITARPTTTATTAPGTATTGQSTTSSSSPTGTSGAAATGSAADTTSTSGSAPATAANSDPDGGADAVEEALAPVGMGDVGDLPATRAGSLDDLLDRLPQGKNGPWTRSIRLALAALLPMALAAGVAVRRWSPPPSGPDDR